MTDIGELVRWMMQHPERPTQRITPLAGCRICRGRGRVQQRHLPGYVETITCECVFDQITDDDADIIIEEDDSWADAAYDSWKERDL